MTRFFLVCIEVGSGSISLDEKELADQMKEAARLFTAHQFAGVVPTYRVVELETIKGEQRLGDLSFREK